MKDRGLFFKNMGLLSKIMTAILVPTLALGILIGGDVASKKVINVTLSDASHHS